MKNQNKIQSIKRTGSLVFGLAMALLLFFQQPYVENPTSGDETAKTEQKKPEAEYHVMAYDILLPVMQFNLFHSFDLIIESLNSDEEDFTLLKYVEKAYHNYFHTLFRLIISPNAP